MQYHREFGSIKEIRGGHFVEDDKTNLMHISHFREVPNGTWDQKGTLKEYIWEEVKPERCSWIQYDHD